MDIESASPCIGVFDSGVGGLSVLRAIRRALPAAPLRYLADAAFAPYGERSDAEILERSRHLVAQLLSQGATLVVVACNSATAAAIDTLRREHPRVPFVGVEPGVRPALTRSPRGRIAVMATEATLRSARFAALVKREARTAFVHAQPCPGLAAAIERDWPLHAMLERFCAEVRAADVDAVALGCTHYPFVRAQIEALLGPGIAVLDTADAVAAQVARLWREAPHTEPSCRLETTGDPAALRAFAARWLSL